MHIRRLFRAITERTNFVIGMRYPVEFGSRLDEGRLRVTADPALAPILPQRAEGGVFIILVAVAVAHGCRR